MTQPTPRVSDLPRTIGPWGLAATVINAIIGSSVFVFPAIVAAVLGAAGIVAYVIAATAMGLVVLCLAESGTRVTATGGTYAYVEAAYGPFVAWMVGLLMYLGVQLVASAVVASVFVSSLSVLVPEAAGGLARAGLLVAIYLVFTVVNVRGGARAGMKVVQVVTIAKLAPLLLLVVIGLVAFEPRYVSWQVTPSWPNLAVWRCG